MYVVALSSHFSASRTYNILSSITAYFNYQWHHVVGSANSYRQNTNHIIDVFQTSLCTSYTMYQMNNGNC